MVMAVTANIAAVVFARREGINVFAGVNLVRIKALLLTQRSFKICSRFPKREYTLTVLIFRTRDCGVLLQEITQQNCLVRIVVRLVAKFFGFRIPRGLRCEQ
jgi:hypothetical protein